MYSEEDEQILRQLRKKKQNFRQVMNKKKVDDFELDRAFNEGF